MKIENIVYSGTLNQEFDLVRLRDVCDCVEYGKNKYPGAYLLIDNHRITLYRTGRYIMPGMKSAEDMENTFDRMKDILAPYADIQLFQKPTVRNMVCSSNLGKSLLLDQIYIELVSRDYDVSYEPEAFPGMILKTENCTYNIFRGGRFIILGCTSVTDAQIAEDYLFSLFSDF